MRATLLAFFHFCGAVITQLAVFFGNYFLAATKSQLYTSPLSPLIVVVVVVLVGVLVFFSTFLENDLMDFTVTLQTCLAYYC